MRHRFGKVFSVFFFVVSLLVSWTRPSRFSELNMASTWGVFGAMLPTFWSFFGCSCGISTEDDFENDFLSIFHRLAIRAILKNTAPADEFEDFCFFGLFALEIDYGPLWGCFGVPKSFQNRPQKGLQRCSKSLQFFDACLSPQKLIFWSTWPQHGPKINLCEQ